MQGRRLSNQFLGMVLGLLSVGSLTPSASAANSPMLDADGYTIQLIALPSAERLEAFARERGVPGLVATSITKDGKTHYVLLLGSFPDKSSALTAAEHLPEGLQDLKPWVRPMANLLSAAPK